MAIRVLVFACLLVLAGCATPFAPTTPSPVGTTVTPTAATATETATETRTPTATGTATDTATGSNPWGRDPIIVAVRTEGERQQPFAPLVREATAFWEENDERYLGFTVEYEVRPDAENPDLVVTYTDSLPECGGVTDAVGCAPRLTDARMIDRPETVWVKTGLSNASTVLVTKHELGHTLGLDHDDPPHEVMQAESVIHTEPRPNATERAFPWDDADFTVRVDAANASNPDGVRTQVNHALTYYEDDPPGLPDDITFERVDEQPEILIRFGATGDCGASGGSCIGTYGTDPDGDGAIETYTRIEITIVGLETDAVGWHVGYWLAHAFGAEPDAEKPPPFRNASYRERRSAWWT